MKRKRKKKSVKQRVLQFFKTNLGKIVKTSDVQKAAGWKSEGLRRLRELRDEEGYQISSCKNRDDLKPNEYLMETLERLPVQKRNISKETRAIVLERDGYTCQMCGSAAGDPDPLGGTRTVRLTMGHIIDKSLGGEDTPSNLRAVCAACNEGLQNAAPPKPDRLYLLAQIRRATRDDQQAVLNWLLKKFEPLNK